MLLTIGKGSSHRYRYLKAARRLGAPLTLVSDRPPDWETQWIDSWVKVDRLDEDHVLAAVEPMRQQIRGVFTPLGIHTDLAARVAFGLGLPGVPVSTADTLADKWRMYEWLAASGYETPSTLVAASLDELAPILERVGLPAVVKPRFGFSSIDVVRVDAWDDLGRVRSTCAEIGDEWLVQPYVGGSEVVTERIPGWGTVVLSKIGPMDGPYFPERGVVCPAYPGIRGPVITAMIDRLASDLGLTGWIMHVELRCDGDRETVLEVAARAGGGLVVPVVEASLGLDLAIVSVTLAAGQRSTFEPQARVAAGLYLHPPRTGVISNITGLGIVSALPGIVELQLYRDVSDHVQLPPIDFSPHWAHVIAAAVSHEELAQLMAEVDRKLGIEVSPCGRL